MDVVKVCIPLAALLASDTLIFSYLYLSRYQQVQQT